MYICPDLAKLFYHIFIYTYVLAIKLASLWNAKARKWVRGRGTFPSFANPDGKELIWMHCASLGEFEQGRPLLEALRSDARFSHKPYKILVSFFSPSGFEAMKDYALADAVIYLPMDSPANARKLIRQINPTIVLWVKYEFWYYYLKELKEVGIPVILVSGIFRKGQPFFKWYGGLWREMLEKFSLFFLQNKYSADLLATAEIVADIEVSGDTRFDRVITISKEEVNFPRIERFTKGKQVIVAGSTWDDDEKEWIHFARANPGIMLILAPHEVHKENLKDVQKEFPGSVFYSDLDKDVPEGCHVLIIDNVGMLSRLYRYADIAYVGGGFGEDGVHNVLEPAIYGIPVIHGPVYEKYAEAVELVDDGGAIVIDSAVALEKKVKELLTNPALAKACGDKAKEYVYRRSGATKKIIDHIYEKRLLTN